MFKNPSQNPTQQGTPLLDITTKLGEMKQTFDHRNRSFGFETAAGKVYYLISEEMHLKLLKRKAQQQYMVALLMHAGDLVEVNKGKEQSDDKLNQSESSRLQTLLARYKNKKKAEEDNRYAVFTRLL